MQAADRIERFVVAGLQDKFDVELFQWPIESAERCGQAGHGSGLAVECDHDGIGRQFMVRDPPRLPPARQAFADEAKQSQSGPGEEDRTQDEFDGRDRRVGRDNGGGQSQQDQAQDAKPPGDADPGRQLGMLGAKFIRGAVFDLPGGMARDKVVQPRRAGETDAVRQRRARPGQRYQAAAVDQARRHDEPGAVAILERQQPGVGGLDQLGVGQPACLPRGVEQRLEFKAEGRGQRRDIGFLADDAPGDQHAIGADPGLDGMGLGPLGQVRRQQVPDAIDLGATSRMAAEYRVAGGIARPRRHERRNRVRRVPIVLPGTVDHRAFPTPVRHSNPNTGK